MDNNNLSDSSSGGQGGLLAEILKIHPKVSGTLFDLPQLVQNPIYLANSGLDKRRWATISGDFFQSVPKGGDAYILKRVLHDWGDEKCVSILRCCRQTIGDDKSSCLLVVDAVVPAGNIPHPSKVQDIGLMVFTSGHERTEQEFSDLFEKADFKLTSVTMTPSSLAIVEAIPAYPPGTI